MLKNSLYIYLCLFLVGCSATDEETQKNIAPQNLAELITDTAVSFESVIACAAGSQIENEFVVYLYPRPGVTNIRYFETANINLDPEDYINYDEVDITPEDFFNGYLLQIKREATNEKWVIITFEENEVLQVSNPIRLKHTTQNTLFENDIITTSAVPTMPVFCWNNVTNVEDVIYFQIVSDDEGNLLSGTYTHETVFQYYNTDNVVLNITRNAPPALISGDTYGFTMLSVSEDNWVNVIVETSFHVE